MIRFSAGVMSVTHTASRVVGGGAEPPVEGTGTSLNDTTCCTTFPGL
jgi:hypothetical protein